MATHAEVLAALRSVRDPETRQDLIAAGKVKQLAVEGDRVSFTVLLSPQGMPFKGQVQREASAAVKSLPGIEHVEVNVSEGSPATGLAGLPGVRSVVAVGSGKGGVGKSTVAVNLAVALAEGGARTGLLDADIYGPTIPIMMGAQGQPQVHRDRMEPLESHGVKLMSLGFMLPETSAPVVWRGPMVGQAVKQMLQEVDWGTLDVLLVDLPPGTGDAALTLAQVIPLSGAVIVMTPQPVAIRIATKTLNMFRGLNVPILGILENMSWLPCPHCNERIELYGAGGGRKAAQLNEVPFLGEIPMEPALRRGGDEGRPILTIDPNAPSAGVFRRVAGEMRAALVGSGAAGGNDR